MSKFSAKTLVALRSIGPIGILAADRINDLTQRLQLVRFERNQAERQVLDMSREINRLQRELAEARTAPEPRTQANNRHKKPVKV